jgi:hypothetical protein
MRKPDVFENLSDKLYNREVASQLWVYFKNTPARDNFLKAYKRIQGRKLRDQTLSQAEWRTKCSRRPQRNNHHDSWSIREGYTRVWRSYSEFTDAHPVASAWSKLRLQQIRRESDVTRLEFMSSYGFRIRPLDKQRHI